MRYVQSTDADRAAMLKEIGVASVEELFREAVPEALRFRGDLDVPPALSEMELARHMRDLAAKNERAASLPSFLGGGFYDHFIPAVVDHLAGRPEFYTSYTQYQPEASQGYLEALFEYQTIVCELTGLDVANASLYDGATALAEAAILAVRATGRRRLLVSAGVHPEHREVVRTYFSRSEIAIEEAPLEPSGVTSADALRARAGSAGDVAGVVFQTPNFYGLIEDGRALADAAHGAGALAVASACPVSLALLAPPGEYGADVAVFEGQPLGVPLQYGGPTFGALAARKEQVRRIPGRIVGETVDRDGKRGYVLTLQTREQHIRRAGAVSNICTNQALLALRGTIHAAVLGREGLREAAELSARKAHWLATRIAAITGYALAHPGRPFFREVAVRCPGGDAERIAREAEKKGVIAGLPLGRFEERDRALLLIAVTEKRTRADMDALVDALAAAAKAVR